MEGAHPPINIADLYAFRSPANPANPVLVMGVRGFIPPADAGSTRFNPRLLYQFLIDTDGDGGEEQGIRAQAVGTGADWRVRCRRIAPPQMTGSAHRALLTEAVESLGQSLESFGEFRGRRIVNVVPPS